MRYPRESRIKAAKQAAVGGRRKRCIKGKNCSAACIAAHMTCLVEMPWVGDALGQARRFILNREPGSQPGKTKRNFQWQPITQKASAAGPAPTPAAPPVASAKKAPPKKVAGPKGAAAQPPVTASAPAQNAPTPKAPTPKAPTLKAPSEKPKIDIEREKAEFKKQPTNVLQDVLKYRSQLAPERIKAIESELQRRAKQPTPQPPKAATPAQKSVKEATIPPAPPKEPTQKLQRPSEMARQAGISGEREAPRIRELKEVDELAKLGPQALNFGLGKLPGRGEPGGDDPDVVVARLRIRAARNQARGRLQDMGALGNKDFFKDKDDYELENMLAAGKWTPRQRQRIEKELRKRLAGSEKAMGLDVNKPVRVGKKLLAQNNSVLEEVLAQRQNSLNPGQRKKIEAELQKRGVQARPKNKENSFFEDDNNFDFVSAMKAPGTTIGQGAFGKARLLDRGEVVKEGKIGQYEAAILKKLQGLGITPELRGVEYRRGALGKTVGPGYGGHVQEKAGKLALEKAPGLPWGKQLYNADIPERKRLIDAYLQVRANLHKQGVAHNDMHGGNVFYDPKTGKAMLIDMGLAQIGAKPALIEALGVFNGRDWQADKYDLRAAKTPTVLKLQENIRKVEAELKKDGIDVGAAGKFPGIRASTSRIQAALGKISDSRAQELVNQIYDGIGGPSKAPSVAKPVAAKVSAPKAPSAKPEDKSFAGLNKTFDFSKEWSKPGFSFHSGGAQADGVKLHRNATVPNAIKKGEIGQYEVAAHERLKDVSAIPKLLGARYDPKGKAKVAASLGGHVKGRAGDLAMEIAPGEPLGYLGVRAMGPGGGERRDAIADQYILARKAIHGKGVAHNDMHDNNVFYDPKTGKLAVIDLGLAQISPKAALAEALGAIRGGGDFQGNWILRNADSPLAQKYRQNVAEVADILKKQYGVSTIPKIRSTQRALDRGFRNLTDDEAQKLANKVYEGLPAPTPHKPGSGAAAARPAAKAATAKAPTEKPSAAPAPKSPTAKAPSAKPETQAPKAPAAKPATAKAPAEKPSAAPKAPTKMMPDPKMNPKKFASMYLDQSTEFIKDMRDRNKDKFPTQYIDILDKELSRREARKVQKSGDKSFADPNKTFDFSKEWNKPGFSFHGGGAQADGVKLHRNATVPNAIKKGEIGQYEVAAYEKLKDAGITPKLLGVRYDSKEVPKTVEPGLGGHIKARVGDLAMEIGAGRPLADLGRTDMRSIAAKAGGRPEAMLADKFLMMRRELHQRGVAHNDMHAGNVMYDPKTGKMTLIDMGLAQVNPKAALAEAIGGVKGGDRQGAGLLRASTPLLKRYRQNADEVERILKDKYGVTKLPGIRSPQSVLDGRFGKLTDAEAQKLVNKLYEGLPAAAPSNKPAPATPMGTKKLQEYKDNLKKERTQDLKDFLQQAGSMMPADRVKLYKDEIKRREQNAAAKAPAPKAPDSPNTFYKTGKDYDLSGAMEGSGSLIGKGAFGKVRMLDRGDVVKDGRIGQYEAAVFKKLAGKGIAPELRGVDYDSNAPAKTVAPGYGGHVKERKGRLALEKADGQPWGKQLREAKGEEKNRMVEAYLQARANLHKEGIAHNDMHGGNVFYDPKTGKAMLIDMGLAQISPKAALIEAMGVFNGKDPQAAKYANIQKANTPAAKKIRENLLKVESELRAAGVDPAKLPTIRANPEKMNAALGKITDSQAQSLVNKVYDGVGPQAKAASAKAPTAKPATPDWEREQRVKNMVQPPAEREKQLKFNLKVAKNKGTPSEIARAKEELKNFRAEQKGNAPKPKPQPQQATASQPEGVRAKREKMDLDEFKKDIKNEKSEELKNILWGRGRGKDMVAQAKANRDHRNALGKDKVDEIEREVRRRMGKPSEKTPLEITAGQSGGAAKAPSAKPASTKPEAKAPSAKPTAPATKPAAKPAPKAVAAAGDMDSYRKRLEKQPEAMLRELAKHKTQLGAERQKVLEDVLKQREEAAAAKAPSMNLSDYKNMIKLLPKDMLQAQVNQVGAEKLKAVENELRRREGAAASKSIAAKAPSTKPAAKESAAKPEPKKLNPQELQEFRNIIKHQPMEGLVNLKYQKGLKLNPQELKEIDKEIEARRAPKRGNARIAAVGDMDAYRKNLKKDPDYLLQEALRYESDLGPERLKAVKDELRQRGVNVPATAPKFDMPKFKKDLEKQNDTELFNLARQKDLNSSQRVAVQGELLRRDKANRLKGVGDDELEKLAKESERKLGAENKRLIALEQQRRRAENKTPSTKPAASAAKPAAQSAQAAKDSFLEAKKPYDFSAEAKQSGWKYVGGGAQGEVKLNSKLSKPAAMKDGKVGQYEAAALEKLQNVSQVPNLYGVRYNSKEPARRIDPMLGGSLGPHIKERPGQLAMELREGRPIYKIQGKKENDKIADDLLRARKAIHMRGVAHNDMHGGNVLYDENKQKLNILDFGLAQISPKAALVEALGGWNARDYQAASRIYEGKGPAVQQYMMNVADVYDKLKARGLNLDKIPGIRTPLDDINKYFGSMTDSEAQRLIAEIYNGI